MTRAAKGFGPNGHRYEFRLEGALLALCLLTIASIAHAFQPVSTTQQIRVKQSQAFLAQGLDVEPELEATTGLAAATSQHPATAAFLARYPGTWEMRWDRRSDRPNLIQGSGIALIPGSGNALTMASLGLASGESVDLAVVETRLEDFIAANADLLGTQGLQFRLDPESSVPYGDGSSHWFVEFAQFHDGVRVDGANLFFRISHGNIVQFGSDRVAPVTIDTQPVSTPANARDLAVREMGFPAGTQIRSLLEAGELLLVPFTAHDEDARAPYLGVAGAGYSHHLAWRFVFRVNDDASTYQVLSDAKTNRVLETRDLNDYTSATVSGGIYPTTNTDTEVVVPFPYTSVTNGSAKVTDALGIYDYSGGTATVTLGGKYFQMADTCGAISLSSSTDGNIAFGSSAGTDCVTPGVGGAGNTHASRSGFYHLAKINEKARGILTTNTWLQTDVTANMNLNQTCNAYWDGNALNFFKSGGGCSNTGEIAAVFLHEWGHGLDTNTGGAASEQGSGEAVGDTFAFLETKDACIGQNFQPGVPCHHCVSCTGVRDMADFGIGGARPIASPANVANTTGIDCGAYHGLGGVACPYTSPSSGQPYRGPMGYEGHCESIIASSANWDLTQALVAQFGSSVGYESMDRIWYGSLTPSKSAFRLVSGGQCNPAAVVDGCGANNWYTVYLAADDNDGNLANGTPNACRIWDAFNAHGIACGARPVCNGSAADFGLTITQPTRNVCAPGSTTYTINVASSLGFTNPVTLAATGLPANVTATFAPNPVTPGSASTMTLTVGAGAAAGNSTITVSGTATASSGHSATTQVLVTTGAPAAPSLATPANAATGVATSPTLTWSAAANAASYTVDIATDAAFTTIVQSVAGITATSVGVTGLAANTAYFWRVRAINACASTSSSTFSFTTAQMYCHAPNLAIPDGSAAGATDSFAITDTGTLTGLKVIVRATHTYVGDLSFTLTKGAGSVVVIDRPGVPASQFGCGNANIDVTLDDASTTLVENQCNSSPPAISGVDKPNNPINAVFAGQSLNGTWSLKAADAATPDAGTLSEWCLVPQMTATSFTVGGSTSGLSGSGLVLSLNAGAQTLPVSASGSFTFPTGLANGTAYAVTVGTQPSGQTCSVANGSGTIAGANVTNVAVTCSAIPTFTVGGTVSGLAGSGLSLSLNNGAQTLPVAANGSFTFPGGLASGASYSVSVTTQPSSPVQTCTVTNGNGTIGSSNVTNVGVACVTSSFTVGGSVSGLAGTGLSLSLNGGAQSLAVAANGAFVFPTGLASGSAYAVTIGTQPASPTQVCSVTNGNGTIGAANVTNVAVTCATSTFTIGGNVTGLSGSGLVLQLNGGGNLGVPANGAFTFPGALTSGTTYAVTVSTQPGSPTQVCTVSNGSGTVAAANVTNVAVACTTSTFTVGGSVSGLAGTGLVLQLNGGGNLGVSANGTFTFPGALASGATFAVTVGTQPGSPTQACTVTNGSGTVGSANVTNVAVTCTTSSFTVGGTVSGLTGSGLVLQVNGGGNLPVTANGAFAFAAPLASGSAYSVTVSTQPVSPAQICSIANGSGTVTSANVTTVAVICVLDDTIFRNGFEL